MDKKYFKLIAPIGTIVVCSEGNFEIDDIPKEAFTHFERGATWLNLEECAVEKLTNFSEVKLNRLLDMRKRQGFDNDVKILMEAISKKQKTNSDSLKTRK